MASGARLSAMMKTPIKLAALLIILGGASSAPALAADTYPNKPIRWVIPFAPGGNYDVTSRLVGEPMGRDLGQTVLIDNKPGAGGVVGLENAVQAPADGIAADSLGAAEIGDLPFEIVKRHVAAVVLVDDADIVGAQATLWDRARIAAEPGGATALAALIAGAYRPAPGERIGVLICGGNVDLAALNDVAGRVA